MTLYLATLPHIMAAIPSSSESFSDTESYSSDSSDGGTPVAFVAPTSRPPRAARDELDTDTETDDPPMAALAQPAQVRPPAVAMKWMAELALVRDTCLHVHPEFADCLPLCERAMTLLSELMTKTARMQSLMEKIYWADVPIYVYRMSSYRPGLYQRVMLPDLVLTTGDQLYTEMQQWTVPSRKTSTTWAPLLPADARAPFLQLFRDLVRELETHAVSA